METLIIPWSENPTIEEIEYRNNGFSKTKGTIFYNHPPDIKDLKNSFLKNNNGVRALQKHTDRFENNGVSQK